MSAPGGPDSGSPKTHREKEAPSRAGRVGGGSGVDGRPWVGVDVGATLAKIAVDSRNGGPAQFELLPADSPAEIAKRVEALSPESVGLTGGGSSDLARRLSQDSAQVNEFAAWGAGAGRLLAGDDGFHDDRYLLVSLGTGTSALLVDGISVTRIGGTALGGGTVLGLGSALVGCRDFAEVCALAEQGARGRVDLLVSDIYRAGEIPLMAELTAANFGKLARADADGSTPADRAAGIMGLVGENVALICCGLAANAQVKRIVFGGSTLRENASLGKVLANITRMLGREATLLPDGEFAGALGSLELARAR